MGCGYSTKTYYVMMPPFRQTWLVGSLVAAGGVQIECLSLQCHAAGLPAAGGAIDVLERYFPETHGYQVLWPICALPILLVIPLVASLMVHADRPPR